MVAAYDTFMNLLRCALHNETRCSLDITECSLELVFLMAKKQSVLGLTFLALQNIGFDASSSSQTLLCTDAVYLEWLAYAARIQAQNEKHLEAIKTLCDVLDKADLPAIFMKGMVCGSRYEEPTVRQCGDIDFVVREADYGKLMNLIEKIATVNYSIIHEHHGLAWINGIQIEPHFKIHNFQNPANDKRMKSFQREVFEEQPCYATIDGVRIRKFPVEFEGMHLVTHMVNHVYEEGLGLRQLIDFYYWLEKFDGEKHLYTRYLKSMKMLRAAKVFTRICENKLGLEKEIMSYTYSKRELSFADKLFNDIMNVGNFARGAEHQITAGLDAYLWTTKRSLRLGYLCPSEAFWWPASKFCRYIHKRLTKKSKAKS